MEVNPTQAQLEKGIGDWIKDRREHERLIEATAFTKCVEHSIFSQKAHPDMTEEQLFNFIYERSYRKLIATAPEKYGDVDEKPTPEMMRLFDRYKAWVERKEQNERTTK